jgi:Protein of unknown function (DUF2510)/Family of unknown function (DUF5362)
MTCPQCGQEAVGRFCGNCGGATGQKSSIDVTEAVDQPVQETSVPASPGKPDDADERRLHGFSNPMPAAAWCPDPGSPDQLRYWNGSSWTEHTSPVAAPPPNTMSPQFASQRSPADQDQLTVQRLYDYEHWSGIAWIVLGGIQVLSVIGILAGAWNIYAGLRRLKTADRIKAQDRNIPAAFQSLTGYIVIGLINLFFGAVIGIVLVGVDLWVRQQVLDNARLFSAPQARTDTSRFGVVTTPVTP